MLRQPEAPADDRGVRAAVDLAELADRGFGDAALPFELRPRSRLYERAVRLESVGVLLDEARVDRMRVVGEPFEQVLGDAAKKRQVAGDARLQG